MKRQFQDYELSAFIEGKEEDYDVEQIVEECTYIDYKTGIRYWDESADLNAICERNRINQTTTAIYKDGKKVAEYETIHDGAFNLYRLTVNKEIKISGHEETFKSIDIMHKYLDCIFGDDWSED